MFTGIVEEIGVIENVLTKPQGKTFSIQANRIFEDLKIEDSVSVSGVCLTVEKLNQSTFMATTVQETLKRSTLGSLGPGSKVNLERAMHLKDRLGGHLVSGHVDGVGKIVTLRKHGEAHLLEIELPEPLSHYCIEKGSITIDGISLTIAELKKNTIFFAVIPFTWDHTILSSKKTGEKVNIETDLIGKYVEKFVHPSKSKTTMSKEWLRSQGF